MIWFALAGWIGLTAGVAIGWMLCGHRGYSRGFTAGLRVARRRRPDLQLVPPPDEAA